MYFIELYIVNSTIIPDILVFYEFIGISFYLKTDNILRIYVTYQQCHYYILSAQYVKIFNQYRSIKEIIF